MTTGTRENQTGNQPRQQLHVIRRIVLVAIILLIGILVARHLIKTRPKVSKRPPEKTAALVSVVSLQPVSEVLRMTTMGTVVPSREIVLKTPVGGEIISLNENFAPGGLLKQGDIILQIDPRDYELTLEQKKKALSDAEYAYKLEQGRQDVARREWDLLYGSESAREKESDLALRKPHLDKVRFDIKAARAEMELAELNLERTTVKAPFNCIVLSKYVDRGAFVAPQEKLADLAGTDVYWVQVSMPLNQLHWLNIPSEGDAGGSSARIYYRGNNMRQGRVIRQLGDLTPEGRMARLLVTVADPLGRSAGNGGQPLVIGEYVRVEIDGEKLDKVFRIPRSALHNDNEIWLATEDGHLAVRQVETVWREEGHVLVRDGLQPGDRLVVSDLAVPIDGMAVRIDQGTDLAPESGQHPSGSSK